MKALGLVLLVTLTFCGEGLAWETLKGCRLLPHDSNDGDSFHVEHEGKEYIFRLYFVDCPESSMQVASRVAEQAQEFGVSEEKVLRGGKDAAKFTEKALRGRFTVVTNFQNARGASALPRYYAMVETADGKDLATLLAEAGFARAFGVSASAPRARGMDYYKRLEVRARRAGAGVFAGGSPVASKPEPEVAVVEEEEAAKEEEPLNITAGSVSEESVLADAQAMANSFQFSEPGVASRPASSPSLVATPSTSPSASGGEKVSLNKASKAELESLPGIGPVLAQAIISGRPFASVEDLLRVKGIGVKTFKALEPHVVE